MPSLSPLPISQSPMEPVGKWLAALIRASSELLDAYVVVGRFPRADLSAVLPAPLLIGCRLHGANQGEILCRIDPALAVSVAEGMWGEPIASLLPTQVDDAAQELCGQIIGYAAGEVGASFPGVLFDPPRLLAQRELPALHGSNRAMVPTRLGSLFWEVSPIYLPQDPAPSQATASSARTRIRALRERDLPLLQAVQVLGVDDKAPDAFEQLLHAVGGDPVLSARILRRVNSALSSPRDKRIQTLPRALLYLGTRAAKNIVISALLSQPVGPTQPTQAALITHSVQVGFLSRSLASLAGLDPDECYLLGLLHDLGRLILDRLYPAEMARIGLVDEGALLEQELGTLGITHTEAGAMVATAWCFPEPVRLVMTAHHDDQIIDQLGLPRERELQVKIVAHADRLVQSFERLGENEVGPACQACAEALSHPPETVRECLHRAMMQYKEEQLDDT